MAVEGKVDEAIALEADCRRKQAGNFCAYLTKHRLRIVNYSYYQADQLCSIGSRAVESGGEHLTLARRSDSE